MIEYHRHLGVYGVCNQGNQLLVVHKTRGPYKNRYDLPGGTIESSESIIQALYREFMEETGCAINIDKNIGTTEFIVKYKINDKTHIQHIALLLKVSIEAASKHDTLSDDTCGSDWINIDELTNENASPLVMAAKQYIENDHLEWISMTYENWIVKEDKKGS